MKTLYNYIDEIGVFIFLWIIAGGGIAFATFAIMITIHMRDEHKLKSDNFQNLDLSIKINAICKKLNISALELNEGWENAKQNMDTKEWEDMRKSIKIVTDY